MTFDEAIKWEAYFTKKLVPTTHEPNELLQVVEVRGDDGMYLLRVCEDCGAVVAVVSQHVKWHLAQMRTAEAAAFTWR